MWEAQFVTGALYITNFSTPCSNLLQSFINCAHATFTEPASTKPRLLFVDFTFSHFPAVPILATALLASSTTTSRAPVFSVDRTLPFPALDSYTRKPLFLTLTTSFDVCGVDSTTGVDSSTSVSVGSITGAPLTGPGVNSVSGTGAAPGTFSKYQAATRPTLPLGAWMRTH